MVAPVFEGRMLGADRLADDRYEGVVTIEHSHALTTRYTMLIAEVAGPEADLRPLDGKIVAAQNVWQARMAEYGLALATDVSGVAAAPRRSACGSRRVQTCWISDLIVAGYAGPDGVRRLNI